MSLILDALRKSERVRHQSLTGQLSAGETPVGPGRLPVPWVTLIGAILVVNALLLFFFWPRPAPAPTPVPVVAPPPAQQSYRPSVRPLAQETDDVVTPQVPAQSNVSAQAIPTPTSPTPAVQIAPAADAPQSIDSLPPELRQSLPVLHMDVHGYATRPADRFVVINLKQYHIGDTVAEGLTLKDIVPQGAVLDYRGTQFLLPAS